LNLERLIRQTKIRINWHGFIKEVLKPENEDHELCAWLFSSHPYGSHEEWHVLRVKEVPKDWDGDGFYEGWAPDKKDLARVKKLARLNGWTCIGTVHTHPIGQFWCRKEDMAKAIAVESVPSEVDLKFQRRFNQIIRGILVVNYFEDPPKIEAIVWHDQYGNLSHICMEVLKDDF